MWTLPDQTAIIVALHERVSPRALDIRSARCMGRNRTDHARSGVSDYPQFRGATKSRLYPQAKKAGPSLALPFDLIILPRLFLSSKKGQNQFWYNLNCSICPFFTYQFSQFQSVCTGYQKSLKCFRKHHRRISSHPSFRCKLCLAKQHINFRSRVRLLDYTDSGIPLTTPRSFDIYMTLNSLLLIELRWPPRKDSTISFCLFILSPHIVD